MAQVDRGASGYAYSAAVTRVDLDAPAGPADNRNAAAARGPQGPCAVGFKDDEWDRSVGQQQAANGRGADVLGLAAAEQGGKEDLHVVDHVNPNVRVGSKAGTRHRGRRDAGHGSRKADLDVVARRAVRAVITVQGGVLARGGPRRA